MCRTLKMLYCILEFIFKKCDGKLNQRAVLSVCMFHWRGGKRLFWKSDSPDELLVIFGLGKLGSAELIRADKAGQLTLGSSCRKSNNY